MSRAPHARSGGERDPRRRSRTLDGARVRARLLLCLCLLSAVSCAERARPGLPARHLLLVTMEGLRADHSSIYLYPRETTAVPVDGGQQALGRALGLDDLAREGVVFANAFAPSADPIASLAALHTGSPPADTRVFADGDALPAERELLAERLARLGFRSAAFVTHARELDPSWRRGFEHFQRGASDIETLGQALSWVGEQDFASGGPTFLWLHLGGPSFPFEPKSAPGPSGSIDFSTRYRAPDYRGDADGSEAFRRAALESARTLSPEDRDEIIACYDGEIAMTTHLLYSFLDFYRYAGEPAGAWRQCLFVFAGTNGVELFRRERRWGQCASLGDETIHVPLFVRHPDSLTGRRIFSAVVELQDLLPTLVEFFGGHVSAEVPARSLLALTDSFRPRAFEPRPAISVLGQGEAWSLRTSEWHLIESRQAREGSQTELYRVGEDRREIDNRAAELPQRTAETRRILQAAIGAREAP